MLRVQRLLVLGGVGTMLACWGAGCCAWEVVPVAECGTGSEPGLSLTVQNRPADELPLLVAGRACGQAIDAVTLADEYEVVLYAFTDKYYVQPFADRFRLKVCPSGYFTVRSHTATRLHAFLARRGLDIWPTRADTLPQVDGEAVIAEAVWDR
jgi:hypothetical protein